jgi:hypothetical protein
MKIQEATSRKNFNRFLQFPYDLYNHKLPPSKWVAPLRMAVKEQISIKHNPFFKEGGKCFHFIATDHHHEVVGRFSLTWCPAYVNKWKKEEVFFGFYEQVNDAYLAKEIFETAQREALQRFGTDKLLGPVNLSTNYQVGMLMDHYDEYPFIDMLYNPSYYPELFEQSGVWEKATDLYTFGFRADQEMSPKVHRVTELLKKRHDIEIRAVSFKDFETEKEIMREIYNDAWSENWGFIPISKEEWGYLTKDFKKIAIPEFILIGSIKGVPFGFSVVLPDINQVLRHIRNGKLLPTGLFKLLWGQRKINRGRLLVLGIMKKYQHLSLGSLFYVETHKVGKKLGYTKGELSWILENNHALLNTLKQVQAQKERTYRLYRSV